MSKVEGEQIEAGAKERVLLVDDDPNVLAGCERNLRRHFDISTAETSYQALLILKEKGPFAVIVSDYRMPAMNGVQLLCAAREIVPETARIMLTGQADMQAAIDAINKGSFFRFLVKPCSAESLLENIQDGIHHYRLMVAERDIMEKTLKSSIKVFVDTLSMVNPTAFSRTSRVSQIAANLAKHFTIEKAWEIEYAALLSHIGCVTVPETLLAKKYKGDPLSEQEDEVLKRYPMIGRDLLAQIPRLEGVAEAIAYQNKNYDGTGSPTDERKGADIPLAARFLKVALDYDLCQAQTLSEAIAKNDGKSAEPLEAMLKHAEWYDPKILTALQKEVGVVVPKSGPVVSPTKELTIAQLQPGMVLASDIDDNDGNVVLPRGFELKRVSLVRLLNALHMGAIENKAKVFERSAAPLLK